MYPFISIIIPVRNEERYIKKCIDSLLLQDYPFEYLEIIFVDGLSTDNTKRIIEEYMKNYNFINLLINQNKTVPYAMNIGIENCKGEYIIRMDAHSEYQHNYISKCVEKLQKVDADVVGGLAITKGNGVVGKAIAKLLSSPFGVGNAKFRINSKSGYVDTVPFGAFKREVFEKYGGYDTRLTRNQDNEMSYRVRKNGGKIYLSDEIKFTYYCRDNIKDLSKMGFQNGKWNIITNHLVPGSMSIRHFIPFIFVLSLLIGIPLLIFQIGIFKELFILELIIYTIVNLYFSFKYSKFNFLDIIILFVLHPLFHISYGFGSVIGILSLYKYR